MTLRYHLLLAARSRAVLAPAAAWLFVLAGVYAYPPNDVGGSFAVTAGLLVPLSAWLAVALSHAEPAPQLRAARRGQRPCRRSRARGPGGGAVVRGGGRDRRRVAGHRRRLRPRSHPRRHRRRRRRPHGLRRLRRGARDARLGSHRRPHGRRLHGPGRIRNRGRAAVRSSPALSPRLGRPTPWSTTVPSPAPSSRWPCTPPPPWRSPPGRCGGPPESDGENPPGLRAVILTRGRMVARRSRGPGAGTLATCPHESQPWSRPVSPVCSRSACSPPEACCCGATPGRTNRDICRRERTLRDQHLRTRHRQLRHRPRRSRLDRRPRSLRRGPPDRRPPRRQPGVRWVARTADVTRYLSKAGHELVTDLDYSPFSADYRRLGGDGKPAPPAEQRFWEASAHGSGRQTVTWDVDDGVPSIVVMNADASRGVDAASRPARRSTSLRTSAGRDDRRPDRALVRGPARGLRHPPPPARGRARLTSSNPA